MVSRILVPLDGSRVAQMAADYAIGLAPQLNASIIAVRVVDKRPLVVRAVPLGLESSSVSESPGDYRQEAIDESYAQLQERCENSSVEIRSITETAASAQEIVEQARQVSADLIVVGWPGKNTLDGTGSGNMALDIIHKETATPILVVKE